MSGIISYIRNAILFAIGLAFTGTLLEVTGLVGREAIRAHQHGGISFRWLNRQLEGPNFKTPLPSSHEGK
jgi:hypothetical protein